MTLVEETAKVALMVEEQAQEAGVDHEDRLP
jgi:hypothetical protein